MKKIEMRNKYLLCLPLVVGLLPLNAYAYLDPGTTGIILQALIGGFVAAMAFLSVMRHRITSFLKGLFGKKPDGNSEEK
ncbi:MAG: hypothetical protein K0U39_10170 [Alphaproteobacteria bacterium]|nr:hypothetical protein [Alphaproteobacteria bacterium]